MTAQRRPNSRPLDKKWAFIPLTIIEIARGSVLSTDSVVNGMKRRFTTVVGNSATSRVGDDLTTITELSTTIPEACQRKAPRRFLEMRLSQSSFLP
jgi:hypothetical protein